MKHLIPSYRVPPCPRLFWIHLIVAVSAALLFWLGAGAAAKASHAPNDAVTVRDLVEPNHLVTTSQRNDATAFREEDAGFSAHYRVPHHVDSSAQSDGLPRLNVEEITRALLEKPDDSNANRNVPGIHVDSGANFGIVRLPMHAAIGFGTQVEPREVTVYYDDRGWVVAYLPPDEPAVGIWRYDRTKQPANDLEQNLLVLAINEVLTVARKDVPEIVYVGDRTVGYYHWKYPQYNAYVLFSHTSNGGESEPVRFVVPPTIESILASASVLITSEQTDDQPTVTAGLMVDDSAVVTVQEPTRLDVSGFALERTRDATSLHEVTVAVDDGGTAAGAVMLLYTKPGS